MTAVAVVLAGGRGTRSADPTVAKLAQTIGGESLMAWHMRLLDNSQIDEILVVAGHLGEQVQQLCDSISHDALTVTVVHEEEQQGTVAALRLAADHTTADEFLVVLGDILMSFRVDAFLDAWRSSGKRVAVIVHPSSHPEDSDAAFATHDGSVRVVPKAAARHHIPNMSSAGLFVITRKALERYGHLRDIGSDVLPAAAGEGERQRDVRQKSKKQAKKVRQAPARWLLCSCLGGQAHGNGMQIVQCSARLSILSASSMV